MAFWNRGRKATLDPRMAAWQGYGFCGHHPYALSTSNAVETWPDFLLMLGHMCTMWVVLWYVSFALTRRFVLPLLPRSSVEHENRTVYVSQKFVATAKALLVSYWANVAVYQTWVSAEEHNELTQNVAAEIAGGYFTSFEIVDLVLGSLHGLMEKEYVVHHSLHIVLGILIRGLCSLSPIACILMSQETSSLFLSYFLLLRHRTNHWSTIAAFVLFVVAFTFYRLGLNTYGTIRYLLNYREHAEGILPLLPLHGIAAVLLLAMVLQWYWGFFIYMNLYRKATGSKKEE